MTLQLAVSSVDGSEITVSIDETPVTIGRSSRCDIRVPFTTISSHHLSVERRGERYVVFDVGSTNGTMYQGRALERYEAVPIADPVVLDILDTRLTFTIAVDSPAQFTLAESGSLARNLLAAAVAQKSASDDDAFIEILDGSRAGERIRLGITAKTFGASGEVVTNGPPQSARIVRDGEGFALECLDGVVELNGSRCTAATRLRSKARVIVDDVSFVFVDPLESYFDELETEKKPSKTDGAISFVSTTPDSTPEERRGWTAVEWVLLVVAISLIAIGTITIGWLLTAS